MRIAIHQPNLASWFPYFYKMQHCDVFVIMVNCDYEKNGYQNRANVNGNWWTVPISSEGKKLIEKKYVTGQKLVDANVHLILGWAQVLGIDTGKIRFDFPTEKIGTERIIEICKRYDCDQYVTNPEATSKYLNEKLMNENGIEIVPCEVPNQFKRSIYELFNEMGIDGVQKLLKKEFNKVINEKI